MNTATRDILLGLGLTGLAVIGVFAVIPLGVDEPGSVDHFALAPRFWPLIITISLGGLGLLVALEGLLGRRQPQAPDGEADEDLKASTFITRAAATIVGLYVLYFAIQFLGIVATAILAILALTLASGERRLKYVLPVAAILPVALYYFFVHVASVPMPLGLFETLF